MIICVPTPLNKNREPDISYILDTGKAIAPHLRKGMLVVLESTTYPGTTSEVLVPKLTEKGLVLGKDIFVARQVVSEKLQLVAAWFTYVDGAPRWIFGIGPIVGNSATIAANPRNMPTPPMRGFGVLWTSRSRMPG